MAGRARRRILIVYSDYPFAFIHIHLVSESLVKDTVLRFLVHFNLWMVRSEVALSAGVRTSCLFFGETVPWYGTRNSCLCFHPGLSVRFRYWAK